jgi:hypothetical protein
MISFDLPCYASGKIAARYEAYTRTTVKIRRSLNRKIAANSDKHGVNLRFMGVKR